MSKMQVGSVLQLSGSNPGATETWNETRLKTYTVATTAAPLDLTHHQGIGMFVDGDGSGGTLVVRLISGNVARDYAIPLSFKGTQWVEVRNYFSTRSRARSLSSPLAPSLSRSCSPDVDTGWTVLAYNFHLRRRRCTSATSSTWDALRSRWLMCRVVPSDYSTGSGWRAGLECQELGADRARCCGLGPDGLRLNHRGCRGHRVLTRKYRIEGRRHRASCSLRSGGIHARPCHHSRRPDCARQGHVVHVRPVYFGPRRHFHDLRSSLAFRVQLLGRRLPPNQPHELQDARCCCCQRRRERLTSVA